MKHKHWIIFFGVLTVAVMAFIFSHSMKSRVESAQQSFMWLKLLEPLLNPNDQFSEEYIHNIVRKLAHFAEFGALGLSVGGFTTNLGRLRNKRYISLPMLITLACAVCDEWIQYFVGRGSMVTDVIIDYSGALTGLLVVALFVWVKKKFVQRKQEKRI